MLEIYFTQFKTAIAVSMQYRVNQAIWIISLITEPIVYMTVWTNIANAQSGSIGGFNAGEFAAYYIVWMLVRHLAVTLSPEAIEWRIRSGELNMLVLRPIHPVHTDIADNLGYKLVALPTVILMMIGLAIIFPPTFNLNFGALLLFIPVMFIAFLIRFLSHWILGLIALWTTRAHSFYQIFFLGELFLTGRIAPISLLPAVLQVVASILPFRWMIAFPVELFLGRLNTEQLLEGLLMQLIWLAIMLLMLRLVWRIGLRRYSAVGA